MSEREIGIEEARKKLGTFVDDAALDGTVTYVTRQGRRYAAIVPIQRIKKKELAMTEPTYTAAITVASDCVAGVLCDVSVAENDIVGYREDEDGNEIPQYAMGNKVVLDPAETTVRTDEDDPWGRLENEAEDILTANGWCRTGPWDLADNAAYAPVERV